MTNAHKQSMIVMLGFRDRVAGREIWPSGRGKEGYCMSWLLYVVCMAVRLLLLWAMHPQKKCKPKQKQTFPTFYLFPRNGATSPPPLHLLFIRSLCQLTENKTLRTGSVRVLSTWSREVICSGYFGNCVVNTRPDWLDLCCLLLFLIFYKMGVSNALWSLCITLGNLNFVRMKLMLPRVIHIIIII